MNEKIDYLQRAKRHYRNWFMGTEFLGLRWRRKIELHAAITAALIAQAETMSGDLGTKGYLDAVGPLMEQMAQASAKALGGAMPIGFIPNDKANDDDPTGEPE